MIPQLVEIDAYDIEAAAVTTLRLGDGPSAEAFAIGGYAWSPCITSRAVMTLEILSIDLSAKIQAGKANLKIARNAIRGLPLSRRIKWTGSPIRIFSAADYAYDRKKTEFQGIIKDISLNPDTQELSISCEVDVDFLDKPLLRLEMTGLGGANGTPEKIGTLMPAGFGRCENIPPVWVDETRWIGMIDGYGNTVTIDGLMEGASMFGNAVGNYSSFAALANAIDTGAVKPGQWATCRAEGLIGLGATPAKPIGVNATFGSGTTGTMISRAILTHAQAPSSHVDSASLTALDSSVPYPVHFWTADQRNVDDLVQALARAANCTSVVNCQGQLQVTRNVASAAQATLDRSGGRLPRVIGWSTTSPVAPYWQIKMRCERPAQVLSYTDVLYEDDLVDRGAFLESETYRAGNIVTLPNKSKWLYINPEPHVGTGITPPNPTYWQSMEGPVAYADGTPIDDLKPNEAGADNTANNLDDAMDLITGQTASQVVFDLANAVASISEEVMRAATWRGEADTIIYTGDGTPVRTVVEAIGSTTDEHTVFIAFLKEVSGDGVGKFMLTANADGAIVGIEGMAGPNFTQLSFVASKFLFVDNSGLNPVAVLTYSGGIWKMASIEVDTLKVGSVITDSVALNQITQKQYWQATYSGGISGASLGASGEGAWADFGVSGNKAYIQPTTSGVIPAGSEVTIRIYINVQRTGSNSDAVQFRIRRESGSGSSEYIGEVIRGGQGDYPTVLSYEWADNVDYTDTYTYHLEYYRASGIGTYYGAKMISDIGKR